MTRRCIVCATAWVLWLAAPTAGADWFRDLVADAAPEDVYRLLYHMPKGGDLHNHLSGSGFPEWWYELALAEDERGYRYFTKVRIDNCVGYGSNQFGPDPYLLLFRNITATEFAALDECQQGEYVPLADLDAEQKAGWLASLKLDRDYEGRDEFFQTHWQRLNALNENPWLQAEILVRNLQAYAAEGLSYLETQVAVGGMRHPDGRAISADETIDILRERLRDADARGTGMTVRGQVSILRFAPAAEDMLRAAYDIVYRNSDFMVAVNMVGREDNDKGYPLRFLPVLRELRQRYDGVRLSIHAGEVDEPNRHVRDTLLLGADRIGHGLNLISDPDTLLAMRHGPYLVEINLISNLLLNYVDDYAQHPFPEYLRIGVPVALSTDDRGMWDSNVTDEYYVAVREFGLSWKELRLLARNSIAYAFVDAARKQELLEQLESRLDRYEAGLRKYGTERLGPMPATHGFVCARYELCN